MHKVITTSDLKTFIKNNPGGLSDHNIEIITGKSGGEYLEIHSREKVRIITASSGKEIIDIHKTENANLIIADLEMPEMNGDVVCDVIRGDDTTRKVSFVIVCDNEESAVKRCQACKANDYLSKPITIQELLVAIKKYLYISERKSTRIIFQVFVKGKIMDRFFFGKSENISNSGFLFSTDEVIEIGSNISCTFIIGEDIITVDGKVVRNIETAPDRFSYGIQFANISPFSESIIANLINGK